MYLHPRKSAHYYVVLICRGPLIDNYQQVGTLHSSSRLDTRHSIMTTHQYIGHNLRHPHT
jgi:hypothetical protein